MIKNLVKCAIVGKVTLTVIKKATPTIKRVARSTKKLIKR